MKYEQAYSPLNQSENAFVTNQRPAFVKKVYGILAAQLTLTTAVCFLSRISPVFMQFVNAVQIFTIIGTIVTMLWISFSKTATREVPKNYILLGTFTVCESFALSSMIQFVGFEILMTAFLLTSGITIALTAYAMTTKNDITMVGASASILLSAFSMLIFLNIFIRSQFLFTVYLMVGAVSYGYYLVYHTQVIIGGKNRYLELDDYIGAAMALYLDIIQLFIKILKILNQLQESDKKKKESN